MWLLCRLRQSLTQVLPNAGFSRPITSIELPHTLTGTWTGTWTTLPERTPGEPTAAPSAPASANAGEASPRAMIAPATTAALFLSFTCFPFSCGHEPMSAETERAQHERLAP